MNNQPDNSLERWIDRQLKTLPDLEAPTDFAHGVMRALIARQRMPWYRSLWQSGSPGMRAGIVVLLAGGVAGTLLLVLQILNSPFAVSVPACCSTACTSVQTLFGVLLTLLQTLMDALVRIHPMVPSTLVLLVTSLYVICLGAGTTVARLALSRIPTSRHHEKV
jgi:hypothetical protein